MLKRMFFHTAVFTVLIVTGALAFDAAGLSGSGLARLDGWSHDGGHGHDFGKRGWDD